MSSIGHVRRQVVVYRVNHNGLDVSLVDSSRRSSARPLLTFIAP